MPTRFARYNAFIYRIQTNYSQDTRHLFIRYKRIITRNEQEMYLQD